MGDLKKEKKKNNNSKTKIFGQVIAQEVFRVALRECGVLNHIFEFLSFWQ